MWDTCYPRRRAIASYPKALGLQQESQELRKAMRHGDRYSSCLSGATRVSAPANQICGNPYILGFDSWLPKGEMTGPQRLQKTVDFNIRKRLG